MVNCKKIVLCLNNYELYKLWKNEDSKSAPSKSQSERIILELLQQHGVLVDCIKLNPVSANNFQSHVTKFVVRKLRKNTGGRQRKLLIESFKKENKNLVILYSVIKQKKVRKVSKWYSNVLSNIKLNVRK